MKLCIDTFNEEVLEEVLASGLIHGLTMNPLVMAEEGRTDYLDRVQRMSARVAGPVLVQVVSRDPGRMLEEARLLAGLGPRIHVKIAFDGAPAAGVIRRLHDEGITTAATIIYNALQAYLAAEAGASIVALFEGGLHGISKNPIAVDRSERPSIARAARQIVDRHGYSARVLVGAREPIQVVEAALAGAHLCTVKLPVFRDLFHDHETAFRIGAFTDAWRSVYGDHDWIDRPAER